MVKQNIAVVKSAYTDKVYLIFIFLTILYGTCFFQLFSMQTLFYKIEWQLGERLIGGLMALNGIIVALIEMVIVHKLEGKKSRCIILL